MIAKNRKIKNTTVYIDGHSYENCEFTNVKFIFNALMGVHMDQCTFNNCTWKFSGPAENALAFMTVIYHGGGKKLIENTFSAIRAGKKADITIH